VIVVDTSAIIAILLQETDAERFAQSIEAADRSIVSAASVLEVGIVLISRFEPTSRRKLMEFLANSSIEIAAVTADQIEIALDAFTRYGKGQRGPAGLNFGDCFAYALAKSTGAPLLFKGRDFLETDLGAA
jgi:ribonuclease VapC